MLGPSVILVGVGIATGEYTLWPYISSQVGLMQSVHVLLGLAVWAALVGVAAITGLLA